MGKKSLYIIGMALLAVPAALYLNGHLQEDLYGIINKEIAEKPSAAGAPEKKWRSGQILVKPKAGLSDAEFDAILSKSQGKAVEKIGNLPVHIISVPENAEEAVVRALSKNPHIEFAELDMLVSPDSTVVNDPKYGSEWHLSKIQTSLAWDYAKGEGITIAILDTGVDGSHPDLVSQLVPGWNAVDGSTTTSDINGHGTAVAGTAAAASNNLTGVASVAWNAKIMPVRITNDPTSYAYWSDVARGLNWAASNGANVANISYGVSNSSTVTTAAQYMRNLGGMVVVSAMNDGIDPGYTDNPYMISVSATDSNDAKTSWSNYGAFVDVAAPGLNILTTNRGGGYGYWWGTSFASPTTAGVVALIMAANPNLTPVEVEKVLEDSAVKVAGVDFHPYYGYGRVDASAAVQLALNTTAVDSQAPSVTIFSPGASTVVSDLVQVDVSASDNESVQAVSFYANGRLVGTDGTTPYQFSWDTTAAADGDVSLTATAVDSAGNEGASTAVIVTVQNQAVVDLTPVAPIPADQAPPSVNIIDPADGAVVSGLVPIVVSATDDVAISRVDLKIDGQVVSSSTSGDFKYNWNSRKASKGAHTIEALAIDTADKTSNMSIQVTK